LPILFALQNQKIKRKLDSLLLQKTLTKRGTQRILEITQEAGGLKLLENVMRKLAEDSYRIIPNLKNEKTNLRLLVQSALPPFK